GAPQTPAGAGESGSPPPRPAEEPGTPLEPSRKRRPREMVAHDRIRLTGLLRKKPRNGAFSKQLPIQARESGRGGKKIDAGSCGPCSLGDAPAAVNDPRPRRPRG